MFVGDLCGMPGQIDEERSDFDLASLGTTGYDAVGLGEMDFFHGLGFLQAQNKKHRFFVCANVVWSDTGKPLFRPVVYRTYRLQAAPGRPARWVTVAVFSVISRQFASTIAGYVKEPAERISILDPIAESRKVVAIARHRAQLVVALAHMTRAEAGELAARVPGIDIIVLGHESYQRVTAPERIGSTLLVAESNTGKYVGQLVLALNSKGAIEASAGAAIPMDEKIRDHPVVAKMLAALKAKWAKTAAVPKPAASTP